MLIIIASKYSSDIFLQINQNSKNEVLLLNTFSLRYLNSTALFLENKDEMEIVETNTMKVLRICEDEESKRICFRVMQNWFSPYPHNIKWYDLYCGKLHFENRILKLTNKEKFVDCGAFSGDTIFEFLQEVKGDFENIYAFEIDYENFKILNETKNMLRNDISSKIYTYNIGLWSKEVDLFYESAKDGSSISKSGLLQKANSLDNLLKNKDISFIKMDIEGAELEALNGAKEIIMNQKPKLAISIYHELEHFWKIPLLLKSLVPEYKIYIRHHSTQQDDTVCYAVL